MSASLFSTSAADAAGGCGVDVAGCATAAGWANSKRNSAKVAGRRCMKYRSPWAVALFAHEHLPREAALSGSNMETLPMAIKIVLLDRPSVPIPKFVRICGTLGTNFGIERTLAD